VSHLPIRRIISVNDFNIKWVEIDDKNNWISKGRD
jgi:hypothetical protein